MAQDGALLNGGEGGGGRWLSRAFRGALDLVLPPMCLGCGETVEGPAALCPECWKKTRFLAAPVCACCGLPFEADPGPGAVCGECARESPPFARARAAFVYDEKSRGMILAFKHGDRTELAPAFGRWLQRAGAEVIADAQLIVPVPLHWTRLFARRYNQAALMAHELARLAGVPAATDVLVRRRRTPSQGKMGRTMRRRNLAGAFAVPEGRRAALAGRRVLLVDDVLTTGATANACARALLAAGAGAVDVLTLARVVRAE
jgi:ComF family protein